MTDTTTAFNTQAIEHSIDVRQEVCPMTFVRVRLMLDRIGSGATLEVLYIGEEPALNLPRSAVEQGHEIITHEPGRLILRKR